MPQPTRTWSVPTSPRSPYKLANELRLLSKFEGQQWNKATQLKFAKLLPSIDSFEGKGSARYSDFSARDRINRAPKTFGFVRFDDDRKIKITEAGKALISGIRTEELFLRQLLKWQYPSVKHSDSNYKENFCIKPFLEVLRIAYALDGLTKYEIALFCVPLIKFTDTRSTIEEIRKFRSKLNRLKSALEKKKFIRDTFVKKFTRIYRQDIKAGNFRLREGGNGNSEEKFLKTKIRNAKDYADSTIRYFRATGLFTFSATTYRLKIMDTKVKIVEDVLKNNKREPEPYLDDPYAFLDYLGSIDEPTIPQDDKKSIIKEAELIIEKYEAQKLEFDPSLKKKFENRGKLDKEDLRNLRDVLNDSLIEKIVKKEQDRLKDYSILTDILSVFEKIRDRYNDEIPDKPLFFEWNTWRALSLLDDGKIKGNLKIDLNGLPLRIALGNMPDIECYYKDFVLVVEVTLSTGQRQYESEGEPIPRHIGQVINRLRKAGDKRPVYGLFVASILNPAALAHFYVLRKTNVQYYGGKAQILPLDMLNFIHMLKHANAVKGVTANDIFKFFEWTNEEAKKSKNEEAWHSRVSIMVKNWTKAP